MTRYFIADLHLSESQPEITHCFLQFLEQQAAHADALYILGDLFEYWVGDDIRSELVEQVTQALSSISQKGVALYYIHGNRDFMIGQKFCRACGMSLLPESELIDLGGRKALIMHGDSLCTDDIDFQKFRSISRQRWRQLLFLALPLFIRQRIANGIRSRSGAKKEHKSLEIMDVNQAEVDQVMSEADTNLLIHGHTHRPGFHHWQNRTRIVLGDWYQQGSVLRWQNGEFDLQTLEFAPIEQP